MSITSTIVSVCTNFLSFLRWLLPSFYLADEPNHAIELADIIGTVVGVGNIVEVNSHGGRKIRRSVVVEDAK